MKPMQITELLANIKATFVSFFSILMFVALGVAVFLGISWAAPALQNAADNMFDKGSFHNFQIQYSYGLTDDNLKKLAQVDGVSQVEAERMSYETLIVDNRKNTVKVQSLGQTIDTPIIVEGELPAKDGEMAFHAESAKNLGVSVGDTITFEKNADADGDKTSSDKDGENDDAEALPRRSFTVTALVNSGEYVAEASGTYGYSTSPSGTVDGLAWVVDDAFDPSAFHDGYPIVNVRCDSLAGMATFGDDYKQASNELKERIETLGDALLREVAQLGKAAAAFTDHREQLRERQAPRAEHDRGRRRRHSAHRHSHHAEQRRDEEPLSPVRRGVRLQLHHLCGIRAPRRYRNPGVSAPARRGYDRASAEEEMPPGAA